MDKTEKIRQAFDLNEEVFGPDVTQGSSSAAPTEPEHVLGFTEADLFRDRCHWTKLVGERARVFGQPIIEGLAAFQAHIYEEGQLVLHEMHKVIAESRRTIVVVKKMRKDALERYVSGTGSNHRFNTQKEREIMMDGDLAQLDEYLSLLDAQIDFYKDVLKRFDAMHFGVANRIKIYELTAI